MVMKCVNTLTYNPITQMVMCDIRLILYVNLIYGLTHKLHIFPKKEILLHLLMAGYFVYNIFRNRGCF